LDPKETLETNLFATKILAEMCKYYQINRFVFASTCSVYGASAGDDYLTEESDLNPVSLYAESKLMMEKMLSEMSDDTFAPVLLRMGTLYGASPRMRFDLVINLLTAKAVVDKEITVFGGDQWRPFIHVDDAAEFYIECIEQPLDTVKGEIFNIGSEKENYKIIDIAKTINKKIPDSKLVIMNKEEDKRNYKISFKKAYSVFKTRPKKSVESAIDEIKSLPETKEYKKDIYSNKEHVKQAKSK
jgi:nucleoside-diphosphate-sugar epimerase